MPILAQLPGAVVDAVNAWRGFGLVWHGYDGSRWDLVDPEGGVVAVRQGITGLSMPQFDRYTTSTPALAGAQYRGSRTQERPFLLPVLVWSTNSTEEWLSRDRTFVGSMRPDALGRVELVAPDGTSRFLDVRFVDDNGHAYEQDPAKAGWALYAFSLVADVQPYWYADDVVRTFKAPADEPFFMASGGVLHISSGQTTASAFIPNPGDVSAWAVWTVTGGFTGATLAVGGGSVVLPAVANGVTWTIDTRPDRMTAVDQNGTDHSAAVVWNPVPVPAGRQVALDLSLTSPDADASVTARITPLHFRAW